MDSFSHQTFSKSLSLSLSLSLSIVAQGYLCWRNLLSPDTWPPSSMRETPAIKISTKFMKIPLLSLATTMFPRSATFDATMLRRSEMDVY